MHACHDRIESNVVHRVGQIRGIALPFSGVQNRGEGVDCLCGDRFAFQTDLVFGSGHSGQCVSS